ncbi:MAG: nitrate/nitrite transporter NrtS [Candidatus Azotimanducaceae bacterium WSBS_2022_MAG_OTU7]
MIDQMFLKPIVLTAIKIALVVGTMLAFINHGPALLALKVSHAADRANRSDLSGALWCLHLLFGKDAADLNSAG